MYIEDQWDKLTSTEKDMFQRSCRKLLKQTFIVKDRDDESKRMYLFAARQQMLFTDYFSYMGFDINVDRQNGVIMLRNCADFGEKGKLQANRLQLRKIESIVLCCLWTLYADRMRKGNLSQVIYVSIAEFNFELEKYGAKDLDKTKIGEALTVLSRYNLIYLNGKLGDPECTIRLFPSLQFVMDEEEFNRFAKNAEERMKEKSKNLLEDEDDESDDYQ